MRSIDDLPSLRQAEVLIREARAAGKTGHRPLSGRPAHRQSTGCNGWRVAQHRNRMVVMRTTDAAAARAWFRRIRRQHANRHPVALQNRSPSPPLPNSIGSSEVCLQQAFAIDTLLAAFHIEIDAAKHALWLECVATRTSRLPSEPYVQTASVMAAQMVNRLTESQNWPMRSIPT